MLANLGRGFCHPAAGHVWAPGDVMTFMRRIRVALLGLALAVPAGITGAAVVHAAATSCNSNNIILGSFSTSFVTTHGQGPIGSQPATTVTIQGSGFPVGASFSNGGTVYFTDASANQT